MTTPHSVIEVSDVSVEYRTRGHRVHALRGVSVDLHDGETLGIVGESGSGKSTLGRAMATFGHITGGSISILGHDRAKLSRRETKDTRAQVQMVFQDPISSLNPRRSVLDSVAEPLSIRRVRDARTAAAEMLRKVGVAEHMVDRRPHQLSGGQCQRVAIARALILKPKVLICDEAVSALDVSVQAQVLNLLEDMKDEYGLSIVFISHDLAVVKNISDRVCVIRNGEVCEIVRSEDLYTRSTHDYTRTLLASIPDPLARRDAA